MSTLLLLTVLLPLAGAALIWVLAEAGRSVARLISLAVSLITLGMAGWLVYQFPSQGSQAYELSWLGGASGIDIQFSLGLDGVSFWFFGLTRC